MAKFAASFSAVAITAAQDVFEITAPSDSYVLIRDISLGQYTDFGDAAAEILSVVLRRGDTVAGTGGSANTPVNLRSVSRATTSTVTTNNTTVANTSGVVIGAGAWNIQAGWSLRDILSLPDANGRAPIMEQGILLRPSERFVVRITAPADSITANGTLYFEELGNIG